MKKLFIFTILLLNICILSFGQKKAEKQKKEAEEALRQEIWNWTDPAFKATEVPEKWKNESAVILAKSYQYEYNQVKKGGSYFFFSTAGQIYEKLTFRKRIKILDKAALSEYSEFSFFDEDNSTYWKEESGVVLGIRVIKADGKVINVPIDEAVANEIKSKYGKTTIKKVAVSDLEVGDVIDYFYSVNNAITRKGGVGTHYFSPIFYVLQDEYPIVSQNLDIRVMKNCVVNYLAINNSPKLKESDKAEDDITYTLSDKDREKTEGARWTFRYRSLPLVKFQAAYSDDEDTRKRLFASKANAKKRPDDAKGFTDYDEKRILDFMVDMDFTSNMMDNYLKSYIKKNDIDKKSIKDLFYEARRDKLMKGRIGTDSYGEPIYISLEDMIVNGSKAKLGGGEYELLSSLFLPLLAKKINFELLFIPHRVITSNQNLLLSDELTYGLRCTQAKNVFYIFPYNRTSIYGEIPPEVQGAEAYAVKMNTIHSSRKVTKVTIPTVAYTENNTTQNMTIDVIDDKAKLTRQTITKGINKGNYTNDVINWYDFIEDDRAKYQTTPLEETVKKKEKEKLLQKIAAEKEKEIKEREEAIKKNLEEEISDIKVVSLDNFKLEQIGLWSEKPELKFTETHTVEGIVKKVGNNYTVDAGKLIGSQVDLDEKEIKERKYDVFFEYARSYNENITINIPDGYDVQGLDKFNYAIDNQTGGFVSTAKKEGNKVIITANKYYKNNFEPTANWSMIVEFVEAAFQFTQQKLLLKKK